MDSFLHDPQLTLTPARPPPLPSSIQTLSNSSSFIKVWTRLEKQSSPPTVQDPLMRTGSTAVSYRDNLELVYSQKPYLSGHIEVSRMQGGTALQEAPGFIYTPKHVQEKKQHTLSKFCTPFSVKVMQGSRLGSLKQTTIVAQETSTNVIFSKDMNISKSQETRQMRKSVVKPAPLQEIQRMSSDEQSRLAIQLSEAEEVAVCLVYTNGSSQLRPTIVKSKIVGTPSVQGLCVAYPTKNQENGAIALSYVLFSLEVTMKNDLWSWCRGLLCKLLRVARVIAYGGQRVLASIISCFDLSEHSNEWLHWTILDLEVGSWLLNPDCPPESFAQVLKLCGMELTPRTTPSESHPELCSDLSLLGPAMVKIYQRLQEENLWLLFEQIEVKVIPILAVMEVVGIQINTSKLLEFAEKLKIKISRVEELVYKVAGHKFSVNSTAQLRQVLFDELHLDTLSGRKLSTTHVNKLKSTSEAVLNQLRDLHPLPGLVLQYRQLCKIMTTYITGVLPYITDGTLKCAWLHNGAATGRLVSANPNIQAFPKQSINLGVVRESFIVGKDPEEVNIDIRETVESRPGYTLIAADFRSIELRLVAHFSEDNLLLSIINSKRTPDIFVHLASEWLGIDVDEVTPDHREKTKRVVYAIVYGVGKERLAEILNVEPSHAKDLTNSFLGKFPGVKSFITRTIQDCRNKGYLVSICGRRRWFPHIQSDNHQLRLHTERQAVNFFVQGSAADICKCGMIQVCTLLARDYPKSKLLAQIHDEIIFEVPDREILSVADMLKSSLEKLNLLDYQLKVPLEVRLTTGKTWSSLKEL